MLSEDNVQGQVMCMLSFVSKSSYSLLNFGVQSLGYARCCVHSFLVSYFSFVLQRAACSGSNTGK